MKHSLCLPSALAAAFVFSMAPSDSEAAIAYTIANATTLLRFDTATPGVVTTIGNFSGAATAIDGIDFRPANGLLYGYSFAANAVVTINPATGFTTFASTPTPSSVPDLGIDFNPAADRLRLVNVNDQNLRINVDTGATLNDGALAYAAGDPNVGISPTINEVAYTNNDVNPVTGTTLYYVDYALGTLVTTSAPNAGTLNTVGSLGLGPITSFTGFDIFTDPFSGTNTAFAILDTVAVNSGFYSINLATGAATLLGGVNAVVPFGLAIQPAAVPEPGTALAGLIAFGVCGMARRRRPAQA